jgi:hypothetical protein
MKAICSSETSIGFHWDTRRYVPELFIATAERTSNATEFECHTTGEIWGLQDRYCPYSGLLGCDTVYSCRWIPLKRLRVTMSLTTCLYHLTDSSPVRFNQDDGGLFLRTSVYAYKITRCHSPEDHNLNWRRYFHDTFRQIITLGYKMLHEHMKCLKNRRNVGLWD